MRSDWLKHWLNTNNSTPCKPIDNSDLRCCHGNLDPDKIQDVKRVTQEAVSKLSRLFQKLSKFKLQLIYQFDIGIISIGLGD